jgi:hypothetical protein
MLMLLSVPSCERGRGEIVTSAFESLHLLLGSAMCQRLVARQVLIAEAPASFSDISNDISGG